MSDRLGNQFGIRITGHNNWIGGEATIEGGSKFDPNPSFILNPANIVSGNGFHGIEIVGKNNHISGNFIGVGPNGEAFPRFSNGAFGIEIGGDPAFVADDNNIGGRWDNSTAQLVSGGVAYSNLISNNKAGGIRIGLSAAGNVIQENRIGFNREGTAVVGNYRFDATEMKNVGASVTIEDANANIVDRNRIGNQGALGVRIIGAGSIANGVTENLIQGADIGILIEKAGRKNDIRLNNYKNVGKSHHIVDTRGTIIAQNTMTEPSQVAVYLQGDSGETVMDGNVISGCIGPAIVVDYAGTLAAGNIFLNNQVYGNAGDGIRILSGIGNQITQNRFRDNAGIGINLILNSDAATSNDANDPDSGPNNLQNHPVLESAVVIGSITRVTGSMDSLATNSAYPITLEFFDNSNPDPSGYGEGEIFLGTLILLAPGPFTIDLPGVASYVTATATDADGNTSEFSNWVSTNPLLGSIGNRVWRDLDNDGIQDTGEQGFADLPLSLLDGIGNVIDSTTTDAGGYYLFSGLAAGDYRIGMSPPPGYFFSPQDQGMDEASDSDFSSGGQTARTTLAAGQNKLDVDAGLVSNAPMGTNNSVTTLEDAAYIFNTNDFGFSDPIDSPAHNFLAVKITTTPNSGTLTNMNVPVNAGDFVTVNDINAGYLLFTPAANANGTNYASFTFQVQDDGGTANGGIDLDPAPKTMTIDVTAVNDAPVNAVPGSQTTNEDTALVFSSANGNLISISDVDAGSAAVQVSLSVMMYGTLSLSGTTGLTFSMGDGNADTYMTFTGAIADVNAALDGLTFTPDANYNGSTSINISTDDLGNTGGGALGDYDTVNITVSPVNDAPVLGALADRNLDEGIMDSLQAGASDADFGDTLTYSLVSAPPEVSIDPQSGSISIMYMDGPAAHTITVKVTDSAGLNDVKSFQLTVNNIAPTAALSWMASPVNQASFFDFYDEHDQGFEDQTAGFLYSYDFNNDGDFDDPGEVQDSADSVAYYTFTESGYHTIRARIKDKDGGFTDIFQEIFVPEE